MTDDYPIKIVQHQVRPTIEQLHAILELAAPYLGDGWRFEPADPDHDRPRPLLVCPEGDFRLIFHLAQQGDEWRLYASLVSARNDLRAYDDFLGDISLRADRALGADGGLDLLVRELRNRLLPGIQQRRWKDQGERRRIADDEAYKARRLEERRALLMHLHGFDARHELWDHQARGEGHDIVYYYLSGHANPLMAQLPGVTIETGHAYDGFDAGRLAGTGQMVDSVTITNLSGDEAIHLLRFLRDHLFRDSATRALAAQEHARAEALTRQGSVCAEFWCTAPIEHTDLGTCRQHYTRAFLARRDGEWLNPPVGLPEGTDA